MWATAQRSRFVILSGVVSVEMQNDQDADNGYDAFSSAGLGV
jgi:hypothetical protein